MKKQLLTLTLLPLLVMTGCNKPIAGSKELEISVLCPVGAPALAFHQYGNDANFSTNNNPTMIAGYMSTNNYDAIIVDTTSGINAINAGANYRLAATITLGNFFIQSVNGDTTLDKTDTVVLFGNANAIPYKVFTYLYGTDYKTEFCGGGVDKAAYVLETGTNTATGNKADWVFISEPYLYNSLNNKPALKNNTTIDVQEVYKSKNNNLPLMQASIFISKTTTKVRANRFLETIKSDISDAVSNPTLVKENLNEMSSVEETQAKFGINADVAEAVLKYNGVGLGYMSAKENKEAIDSYISLFGMAVTNEEIYF